MALMICTQCSHPQDIAVVAKGPPPCELCGNTAWMSPGLKDSVKDEVTPGQIKLSTQLPHLAGALEDLLKELTGGEKMGFLLLVAPFKEGGRAQYIANVERTGAIGMMQELLERWKQGMKDFPVHKLQGD